MYKRGVTDFVWMLIIILIISLVIILVYLLVFSPSFLLGILPHAPSTSSGY